VLIGALIGWRKVSWRRSGLKAIAPAPICGQQIGEMRVQKKKKKATKRSRGRVSSSKKT
jgi:hypothetical protein